MKALVTGGGGFLGGAIVRALVERGDEVASFSRGEYPALAELGVEQRRGDLKDPDAVAAAVQGADVVFHAAAKPPPWGPLAEYEAINVGGTKAVIEGCRRAGVGTLVYTSTPSVVAAEGDIEGGDESLPYGTDFFGAPYPRTKAAAEKLVLAAHGDGLKTVALRPHLIWGPGDPHFLPRFVAKHQAGQLARIGDGDPLVDCVYVDNAADAHVLAADKLLAGDDVGGRAYFITNDEPVGLWTMVDQLLACAGEGPVTKRISPGVARTAASVVEFVWRTFGLTSEPRITRFVVHQVSHAHWFDLTAARERLGYEPRVSTAEGLRRVADAWPG
jgi:nucleoside-diphosphate-sugar epimerase